MAFQSYYADDERAMRSEQLALDILAPSKRTLDKPYVMRAVTRFHRLRNAAEYVLVEAGEIRKAVYLRDGIVSDAPDEVSFVGAPVSDAFDERNGFKRIRVIPEVVCNVFGIPYVPPKERAAPEVTNGKRSRKAQPDPEPQV